jgi:predicted restriction endonuclease
MKSKARQTLDKDRDYILWLYDSRCVYCGIKTNIIHEIVPISHGNASLSSKNRVTLCENHHNWAHESTTHSIPILKQYRQEYLIRKFELDAL